MTEPLPPVFNRKNPLIAKLCSKKLLTEGCETKRTWHLEIDLLGSGLSFTPGDSLALLAQNDPAVANELIETLGFSGDETVLNTAKEETTEMEIKNIYIFNCENLSNSELFRDESNFNSTLI